MVAHRLHPQHSDVILCENQQGFFLEAVEGAVLIFVVVLIFALQLSDVLGITKKLSRQFAHALVTQPPPGNKKTQSPAI